MALLLVNFAIRAAVALRPLGAIDGITTPDDAYLCLHLARNIADGLGPWYDVTWTNGFQPLYVFLMAPAFRIWPDDLFAPVHAALLLSAVFDTLAIWIVFRFVAARCASRATPWVVAVAWVAHPYVLTTTLNGMETALAFLLLAALYAFAQPRLEKSDIDLPHRHALALGVLAGLAVLARVDALFLVAALAVGPLSASLRGRGRLVRPAATLGLVAVAFALAYGPWALYSLRFTGEVYPVSGLAVRQLELGPSGEASLEHYVGSITMGLGYMRVEGWTVWLPALLVFAAACVRYRGRVASELLPRYRMAAPAIWLALFLFVAYTLHVMAWWFFPRYLFPATLAALLTFAAGFDALLTGLSSTAARKALVALACAWFVAGHLSSERFRLLFTSEDDKQHGHMHPALWTAGELPSGSVVGAVQSGALGYFCRDLKVLNLDGVVSRPAFDAINEGRLFEYMLEHEVDYLVCWPSHAHQIRDHSGNVVVPADAMLLEKKLPGIRTGDHRWALYRVRRPQ